MALSFSAQLPPAYRVPERHITFMAQSVRKNVISPLSSRHRLMGLVSYTSQRAKALAFISRSNGVDVNAGAK